jgi:hypothetical protein
LKQTGRRDEGKNHQRDPAGSRPLAVEITGRTTAEERAKEKQREYDVSHRIACWTMVTGVGTVIAALLAIVAAGIFWKQLGTMQTQLTDEREHFRLDERPILALTDGPIPAPMFNYDTDKRQFAWNYGIKNYGKTSAVSIRKYACISFSGSHFKSGDFSGVHDVADIVQSQAIFSSVFYDNVSQEEANRALSIDGGVVITVVFEYAGLDGYPYRSLICQKHAANASIANCLPPEIADIPRDSDQCYH